ncbi:MAG: glycosyl transferase, partial [Burkholderiales bacterium PBB4]
MEHGSANRHHRALRLRTMRIAIVMPVLQEGENLSPRLRALAPLRARGVRLLVVDGGSTDATWGLARAYADAVLLAPRGRASQMNAGASAALADPRVEVLLFLHADTALPQDADLCIAQGLARAQGGATQGGWGRFDVRIDGPHPLLRVVERMVNVRSRLTGIATGDQAIFVSRAAWQATGGFAPQPLMEDIELTSRL